MSRWKPGAQDRLVAAAARLFLQRGYEATTVADIAAAAGLTERTFFRYFADKREVLFGNPAAYNSVFTDAITAAPPDAAPLELLEEALRAAGGFFTGRHPYARVRQQIIDANPALQEREQAKRRHLALAIAQAMQERGLSEPKALLTAELGAMAFHHAFTRWVSADHETDLGSLAVAVLEELRAVAVESRSEGAGTPAGR